MNDTEKQIAAWLRGHRDKAQATAEALPWWRFRLRFANFVSAATCNKLAREFEERGDHRKPNDGDE